MVICCRDLSFDRDLSRDRCARVSAVFGDAVVRWFVAFALYLLGATHSSIGRSLGMAGESVKTLVKTLHRDGPGALEDRRRSHSTFLPPAKMKDVGCAVNRDNSAVNIDLGARASMHLPRRNSVQVRTVLLTLYDAGLVKAKTAIKSQGVCAPGNTPGLVLTIRCASRKVTSRACSGLSSISPDVLLLLVEWFPRQRTGEYSIGHHTPGASPFRSREIRP